MRLYLILVCVMLGCSSCSSLLQQNLCSHSPVNIPLMEKRNQALLNVNYAALNTWSGYASYSPINHFALNVSGTYSKVNLNKSPTFTEAVIHVDQNNKSTQASLGYFTTMDKFVVNRFEVYAGAGRGDFFQDSYYLITGLSTAKSLGYKDKKMFLQSNFGIVKNHSEIGVGLIGGISQGNAEIADSSNRNSYNEVYVFKGEVHKIFYQGIGLRYSLSYDFIKFDIATAYTGAWHVISPNKNAFGFIDYHNYYLVGGITLNLNRAKKDE